MKKRKADENEKQQYLTPQLDFFIVGKSDVITASDEKNDNDFNADGLGEW
ncbi:MAG: hypothetical protein SOX77_04180 [Candidatus Borkfalkiaceae bacterium]|nr:hypothetical protein [Christensenellaceae bacterium]